MRAHTAIIAVYLTAQGVTMCRMVLRIWVALRIDVIEGLCETHGYAIRRKG